MSALLHAFNDIPDLLRSLFTGKYAPVAVLVTIIYLVAVLLSGKAVQVIREILVVAIVAAGIIAYFKRQFPFVWLMLILLALLIIIRLLTYLLVTIRVNRKNRRIERRALEKAERRRGSWKEKRGYSGTHAPDMGEEAHPVMSGRELDDVVRNETSAREGAGIDLSYDTAPAGSPGTGLPHEADVIPRAAAEDALRKLEDLRQLGLLTDEEVMDKKALLFSRMG